MTCRPALNPRLSLTRTRVPGPTGPLGLRIDRLFGFAAALLLFWQVLVTPAHAQQVAGETETGPIAALNLADSGTRAGLKLEAMSNLPTSPSTTLLSPRFVEAKRTGGGTKLWPFFIASAGVYALAAVDMHETTVACTCTERNPLARP